MPENTENIRLVIQASAPQSNGVTRAYSKAVQIGEPREVQDAMINLKEDYKKIHGAAAAGE